MNHQKEDDYGETREEKEEGEEEGEPYFDPATKTNVTSLVGAVARLGCSVHNLGDKTVSGRVENY